MERRQADVELALLRQDMEEMKSDVKVLAAEVKVLVGKFNEAQGTVSFIKWSIGVAAGLAAIFAVLKGVK